MEIPKIISRRGRKYIFVKAYSNYYMYEDIITHCKKMFLITRSSASEKQYKDK